VQYGELKLRPVGEPNVNGDVITLRYNGEMQHVREATRRDTLQIAKAMPVSLGCRRSYHDSTTKDKSDARVR
jgi:hypothetical protein